jgi:hypothetical protein
MDFGVFVNGRETHHEEYNAKNSLLKLMFDGIFELETLPNFI